MTITKPLSMLRFAALGLALVLTSVGQASAAGGAVDVERQEWSFSGLTGTFDKPQLQRGYQVYKEVCAACHGLNRIAFRNLVETSGPGFPEEAVKALAATYEVEDGPNDEGAMFMRPGLLSDRIPSPFKNENEARSIHNGAYPPDLSNIIKARSVGTEAPWWTHIGLMARDILTGYQEGGADYMYALLTGYKDEAPEGFKMSEGMNYNAAYPGHQIAMPNPLSDGLVTYQDGTPETVDSYARDVTAFLTWTSDPQTESRKFIGWIAMLYLLITAVLLYVAKRRIWADAH